MRIFLFSLLVMGSLPLYAEVCVNASRANLRAGPSTQSTKTWEVYKFMPLQKLRERNGWVQVRDVDGDTHWILKRYTTNKFDCVVVKEREARIRKGPSTKFSIVPNGMAKKYYSYRLLKKEGAWIFVEDAAGGKGWIHRDSVWIQ